MLLLGWATVGHVRAGGSGLNVVVIANQWSSNSCELANYYCELRAVPPENLLRITWGGDNISWLNTEFQAHLLTPLLDMLASRQLTNQIEYVVLSMDIPFQTINAVDGSIDSTTSALFYGLRSTGGTTGVTNSYAASEAVFSQARPTGAPGYSFLTTMITGDSLPHAKLVVNQGVGSDGTFPGPPVVLAKSSDPNRNIRYLSFDNAIFNADIRGVSSVVRTNTDALPNQATFLGYETGLANFSVPPGAFVPGAMADSLTSYGGVIFGPNGQTSLLAMLNAGAAGSYGTVAEPGSDTQKFPDPQVYFYQARGFSLAESYYQSLKVPYLGLIVGEPLAAPFRKPATGNWVGVVSNTPLSGTVNLSVQFSAQEPLQQLDLFVDGKYLRTLNKVAPGPGNVLTVALNNYPVSYAVPTNSTLQSIAAGLSALLNVASNSSATRVLAYAHGDRIELQSVASNYFAYPYYFADTGSQILNTNLYRASYITWPIAPTLTDTGWDLSGGFRVHLNVPIPLPYTVQASTDLVQWTPILTNYAGTSLDFLDGAAAAFGNRFYRLVGTVPYDRPRLSSPSGGGNQPFKVRIDSPTWLPYTVQASSDLQNWTVLLTNLAGGAMDFADAPATNPPVRFYRVLVMPQNPGAPSCTIDTWSAPGQPLVRVDGATAPYTIEVATNSGQWTSIFTNAAVGGVQTTVSTSAGTESAPTCFLTASRPAFLNSEAFGYYAYKVLGTPSANAWLQLNITKTNGVTVSVALTNVSGNLSSAEMAAQLCAAVNTNQALQGSDGVVAEDLTASGFNLRARSPGLQAAALGVWAKRSGLSIIPSTMITLTNNLSDLRPRNHLYVSGGSNSLGADFALDTTTLADGFHEFTAVAYGGNHVRAQSQTTLPVLITNSTLTATLSLLDLTNHAPVAGSYNIQVAANTNTVSLVRLFSTGGMLAAITNQSLATFTLEGSFLGAGLHPFYALVDTLDGQHYRTEKQQVRLVHQP